MTTMWLGLMEVGGYTLTVIAKSKRKARKALRAEHARGLTTGAFWAVEGEDDPLEYFGANFTKMTTNKVVWL